MATRSRRDGTEIKINEVQRWLSPVTPSKILATHLTYRSRAEEYKMARMPSEPSYFMKPPSSVSGPSRSRCVGRQGADS